MILIASLTFILGLSGLKSALTEKVSDRFKGLELLGISVTDEGLGEGVFVLERGGESTSSSGDVLGDGLGGEASHLFSRWELGDWSSSPLWQLVAFSSGW